MLALLPLDDRPCNYRFPAQIAAIGGSELLLPPRDNLGKFARPGRFRALDIWLATLPVEVEALIVSVDMLAYGGLVASRRPDVSMDEALERLDSLSTWRSQRPGVPIYAFNVLMRLAVTMDSDAAISHYYNVMRWARLADEAPRFKSAYLAEQLASVEAEIPVEVLESYKAARARNHAINLKMVEALAGGVVDFLLIAQEDCTEYGLHRQEQAELLAKVAELGVGNQFALHPGADEGALTLLARHWNTGVSFKIHPSSQADMERIPAFEDVPYARSLESHIAAAGGRIVEENADFELFVNAPAGNVQRDEKEEAKEARLPNVTALVDAIEAATGEIALCDVAFPNGADDLLMRHVERRGLLHKLSAFAAWNTAGNTTGTILAQCAALKRARAGGPRLESELALRQWLFERYLDDWCYQTHLRTRVERAARDKGLSPLNMNGDAGSIEALTRLELTQYAHMIAARHFDTQLIKLDVWLPWGRTFEVELRAFLADPVAV